MSERPSRTVSALTLAGLVAVFFGMAFWGLKAATKPLASSTGASAAACSANEISVQRFVKRADITVSVYNAGARKGFAQTTLGRLEDLGFKPGAVGNSPTGEKVDVAVVYTSSEETAAAELVARTLGKGAVVKRVDDDFGPGVDVFIGPGQRTLDRGAPARLKLKKPIETCVKVS